MKKYIQILIVVFVCSNLILLAQTIQREKTNIKFFGLSHYEISGTSFPDSLKENTFDRIPKSYKNLVRNKVWNLSKHSAGLAINFETNSPLIKVRWNVLNNNSMPHMAETGIKGLDLYCNVNNEWVYVATAKPDSSRNVKMMIKGMDIKWRKFKIFLPLYDCATLVEIGIDSSSHIRKPVKQKTKPIVFYGTSITQGGCATRPGMAYTNIISRKLNIDCLNFGFSGNGKLEANVAEILSKIDAAFYVIDCLPNVSAEQVAERTIPLVDIIRSENKKVPIVLVESQIPQNNYFVKSKMDLTLTKNETLLNQFKKMVKLGYENIFYIHHNNMLGNDHDATVDGVHFTDLGFLRYSENLIVKFKELGLL